MLVVDDDRAVLDSLKFVLELEGLQVRTYASGRHLLGDGDLAGADCLVLDVRMPDMDGFAVIAELTAREISLPVIMITAPLTDALCRQAEAAHVFSLLEKPLAGNVLANNIHRAMA
ncbi:MAG TPA: response regulator [Rhizomicrobium sp.]